MTSSNNNSFLYAFLLITNILLISSAKLLATNDDKSSSSVEFICSKAQDPVFCKRVFGSDPRSGSASVPELGQIIFDLGISNATAAEAEIKKMLVSEKDTQIRARLNVCKESYDAIVFLLKGCVELAKGNAYAEINVSGQEVGVWAHSCEDEFKKSPVQKFPLADETYLMERFSDIIVVISFHW